MVRKQIVKIFVHGILLAIPLVPSAGIAAEELPQIQSSSNPSQNYSSPKLSADAEKEFAQHQVLQGAINDASGTVQGISAQNARIDKNGIAVQDNAEAGSPTLNKQKPYRDSRYSGNSVTRTGMPSRKQVAELQSANQVPAEVSRPQHVRNTAVHRDSPELKVREEKRQKRKEGFKAILEKNEKRKQILERQSRGKD